MTLIEVKKGLIDILKKRYPPDKYSYYGKAVMEGLQRPSFFTQLKPIQMEAVNYNTRINVVAFYITFFQTQDDEAEALRTVDDIKELFGLSVKVDDRALDVKNYDFDFIGEDRNTVRIVITLEWLDKINHEESDPPYDEAGDLRIRVEYKED